MKGGRTSWSSSFISLSFYTLPWHLFFSRKGKDPEIDGFLLWHTWQFLGMQVCSSHEDKRGFSRHLDNFGPANSMNSMKQGYG